MNRREKRRLDKLRNQSIDEEFKRLTKEEIERRKKKLQDKELAQKELLEELEKKAGKNPISQTRKREWWRKERPRAY